MFCTQTLLYFVVLLFVYSNGAAKFICEGTIGDLFVRSTSCILFFLYKKRSDHLFDN